MEDNYNIRYNIGYNDGLKDGYAKGVQYLAQKIEYVISESVTDVMTIRNIEDVLTEVLGDNE